MSYTYGVVHGIVTCEDCGWHTESYKNAQAIAAKHAKKYGHKVSGELGIAFSYDYRSSPSRIKEKAVDIQGEKVNGGLLIGNRR